ncbi:hypothetical protein NW752_003551 [Fusarium irregulare]|uniref:Zn(2)-C6 fungal-type domain-containing protein n=1 Tax=Fusarium irregulare TaxID=2494466 RepID=A0A9W8PSL3_9HYPO|nr:hypothetical protein NW766_004621 [Fusarium irregulare]KAJ4023090.1 hypothetical protein NW752_003551 [Fusarium irregulare]
MSNYMDGLSLGFGFNNGVMSEGLDSAQQSTTSPASNTNAQQDVSSFHVQPNSFQGNVTVYQTTGPEAHTSPIQQPGSNTPALNPRSCVTCRRRKVRCDKQMPCSNCRRAQIPCVFPAPGRAPRQPRRKDPNAPPKNSSQREIELMKRLRKLEGIVEELSGQIEVESGGKGQSSASSPEVHSAQNSFETSGPNTQRHLSNASSQQGNATMTGGSPRGSDATSDQSESTRKGMHKKFGRLVLNDNDTSGSRKYVSHGLWAKLNDELDSIREETQRLTDEDFDESDIEETPDSSPAVALSANHNAFIFGYRSTEVDLDKYWPVPSVIPFLWSVYQENVEPLLKVLHIPTMEPVFRDARRDHKQLSPGNEALVWAIYYAAITSLDPDEVRANLSVTKEDILVQYRFAVEQALAKANFLNSLDTPIMQALLIFLLVVKGHDGSRFCWSLTGLIAHLAQGMGLHRDGSHFGLSPFETEMRRRLWWSLLLLDLRSADELGTDLIIQDFNFDTQMPSNINDADIKPDSTEAPEPREGHSDCAVAIVRFEIAGFGRRLVRLSSASMSFCPKGMPFENTTLAERERMLIDVYRKVEHKFLKHVTIDTDPLYWMAASIARIIMAKMTLVIYQPVLFPGSDGEGALSDEARERAYMAAIEIAEYNHILNNDTRCKQFRWLFKTYTNWSAMAYFLIASCRRPWTPLVERGWEAINCYEDHPAQLWRSGDNTSVVMPIRKLYMRAQRHRATEIVRLRSNPEEARRLEFEERTNPRYQVRFGQETDLTVNKMDEVREKWRNLVRSDGSNVPISTPAELSPVALPDMLQPQPQIPSRPRTPSVNDIPASFDLSDTTMNFMNDMMAQGTNFNMTGFWPLNDVGAAQMKAMNTEATPMTTAAQIPQTQALHMGQQFNPQTMQLPKDENQAPYLWTGGYPTMNSNLDQTTAAGMDDIDMLGEDFNWHHWSQNVRGM